LSATVERVFGGRVEKSLITKPEGICAAECESFMVSPVQALQLRREVRICQRYTGFMDAASNSHHGSIFTSSVGLVLAET